MAFSFNFETKQNNLNIIQKKSLRLVNDLALLTSTTTDKSNSIRDKIINDKNYAETFYNKYKEYYLKLKAESENKNITLVQAEHEMNKILEETNQYFVFIHKDKESVAVKKLCQKKFNYMKYFNGVIVEKIDIEKEDTPFS